MQPSRHACSDLHSLTTLLGASQDPRQIGLSKDDAESDVYVVPPRESADRACFQGLLRTAAYVQVNKNAKWEIQSDPMAHDLGFCSPPLIPQLFLRCPNGRVVGMVAKIGEDVLLTGEPDIIPGILSCIDATFTPGTCSHGPEPLC